MGKADKDVLALDSDPKNDAQAHRAAAGLTAVNRTLDSYGMTSVLVDSGSQGHRHLFARVTDPDLLEELSALARRHGIDVRTGRAMIRPPLAPHRLGLPVALLEPSGLAEALVALQRPQRRPLSSAMQDLLLTGDAQKQSPSDNLQSLVLAMYQRGWTMPEIADALLRHPGGRSMQKYKRQGRERKELRRSWQAAVQYQRARPAISGQKELAVDLVALRATALAYPWRGVAGASRRMVVLAIIHKAIETNQITVYLSQRDTVEATSRSTRKPVSNAISWLAQEGWFTVRPTGDDNEATRYELNLHRASGDAQGTLVDAPVTATFLTHDCFARGGGLGASAAWVYEALRSWAQDTRTLSARANLGLQTVQRALLALERRDLARREGKVWVRGDATVDGVARKRGSEGAGEDLKAQHVQERFVHRGHKRKESGGLIFHMKDDSPNGMCSGLTLSGAPCRAKCKRPTDRCVRHQQAVTGTEGHRLAS